MHKTKMEPNKVIDSDVYKYRSGEIALSEATRITNKKTGVTVKISPNAKAAYTVMRYRYSNFSSTGKKYYDNEDQIAAGSSISIDTVARVKKDLSAVGLIEIYSKQVADKRSNSYVVRNINPDDFLLERQDKKLGWVNCLDYPVFGNHEHLEPETTEEQETETKAVTQTSPQEPQQPATNPALPSDVVQNETESSSDDDQDEQQTESPPDTSTEEITKPAAVYPWGSSGAFNPNRSVTEPAKQWALSKTGGNVYQAERYLEDYLSEFLEKPIKLSFEEEEEPEDLLF